MNTIRRAQVQRRLAVLSGLTVLTACGSAVVAAQAPHTGWALSIELLLMVVALALLVSLGVELSRSRRTVRR